MRLPPLLAASCLLLAAPVAAQKPWETRVDLTVPVPIELPEVPPTNPFAAPLAVQPVALETPLAERFDVSVAAEASAYVDANGTCRRVVFTRLPLPGLAAELQEHLTDTDFTPAKLLGASVPTWAAVAVDLSGRIDEGKIARMALLPPDPLVPPIPDEPPAPAPEARDLQIPATRLEQLDQIPTAKRFRVRIGGQDVRQAVRLLLEIGADGRCQRVVFLSCPEGMRQWLLRSLAGWRFQPAQGSEGATVAWALLDAELAVEIGTLRGDALRLSRQSSYPYVTP